MLKLIIPVAVIGALLSALPSAAEAPLMRGRDYVLHPVGLAHDGDTFRARVAGQVISIRPEGYDSRELGEPAGPAARAALRRVLSGNPRVVLTYRRQDRYRRALGTVHIGRWPWRRTLAEIMLEDSAGYYRRTGRHHSAPWRGSRAKSWEGRP